MQREPGNLVLRHSLPIKIFIFTTFPEFLAALCFGINAALLFFTRKGK